MRIILINPPYKDYGGIKGLGGSVMPLNLCYLASYARKCMPGSEIKIIDSEISGSSHEDIVSAVAKFAPDIIGITVNTPVFESVRLLTRKLKYAEPDIPIILGGPHVSALPKTTLTDSAADLAVIGEGEITFQEILSNIREGTGKWGEINGLAYRVNNEDIRVNHCRTLIEDLDTLPCPARDLIDNNLYSPPPTKRVSLGPNTMISTSRGCPFNCGFCGAQNVWGHRIRSRSPGSILEELKECISNFGIESFNFSDELFTMNKKHVHGICDSIIRSGIDIKWVCSARAQGLDRETLELMKRAGCYEISFGIESGNSEILDKINKDIDLAEALRVVRLTKRAGISTHANYIIGYIGETEKTIDDTIRFAQKLNTDIAAFFIASPLPGTRLYKEASELGYIRKDATWADYSPLSRARPVMELPGLDPDKVRRLHKRALKRYYMRPRYIISRLLSIRHWHEIVNAISGLKYLLVLRKMK